MNRNKYSQCPTNRINSIYAIRIWGNSIASCLQKMHSKNPNCTSNESISWHWNLIDHFVRNSFYLPLSHAEQALASNHINHWKRSGNHFLRQELRVRRRPFKWVAPTADTKCICHGPVIQRRTMNEWNKTRTENRKSKTFSSGATIAATECKHVCKSQIVVVIVVKLSVVQCLRGVLSTHFRLPCVHRVRNWTTWMKRQRFGQRVLPRDETDDIPSVCSCPDCMMAASTIVIDFVVCRLWRLPRPPPPPSSTSFCSACPAHHTGTTIINNNRHALRLPASICVCFFLFSYFQFHNELRCCCCCRRCSCLFDFESLPNMMPTRTSRSQAYCAYVYFLITSPRGSITRSLWSCHSILILKWMNRTEHGTKNKIK